MRRYKLKGCKLQPAGLHGDLQKQAQKFKTDEKRPLEREEGIVQER